MVKDERNLDKFDRAFSATFKGLEEITAEAVINAVDIPAEWLRKLAENHLSDEEKAAVDALGGFEKLMETLKERLKEQEKSAIKGAVSGLVLRARHPMGPTDIIPKVCGLVRPKAVIKGL